MREWLSGGVSPCQGEGRGFESRLALFLFLNTKKGKIKTGLPLFVYFTTYYFIFEAALSRDIARANAILFR